VIRVVLDSGVLATGTFAEDSTTGQVLQGWRHGAYRLIVSEPILRELRRTFDRPYFRQRMKAGQVSRILTRIQFVATFVAAMPLPAPTAAHASDDLILSTADAGNADYLVTGDAELRKLERYRGVRIVTPREFLDVLAALRLDEAER
jgi:uncharacterized protein